VISGCHNNEANKTRIAKPKIKGIEERKDMKREIFF